MKDYKLKQGSSVILDLIRGVSAQAVVIGHGLGYFGILTFLREPNFPAMQNIAVLIFFLLSGFLITYSTIRKINKSGYGFSHYFADRFSRIYTAFIPSIIFVLVLDLISKNLNPSRYAYSAAFNIKAFVGNLFMLQDYSFFPFSTQTIVTTFGSARPFWTLAIEWWIYLSFGYLLLVVLKKKKVSISSILIFLFLSIVPAYNLISGRGNGLTTYWLFGSLIYVVSTLNILQGVSQKLKIFFTIVISGLALYRAITLMTAYDPIFAFLLAMVLWLIVDLFKDKTISVSATKIIQYNASFSYTLYLVHYSILDFIKVHFTKIDNPYVLFIIAFIIANIISILIGRYTELGLTKKVKLFLYKQIEDRKLLS